MLTFGFYNSVGGDRVYDALQMSQFMKGVISDGIFSSIGTQLKITTPGGLTSYVGVGRAWFNNTWTENDSIYSLTHDAADLILPRIDTVVIEIDSNVGVRANSLKIIKGTPASLPVAPTLINTALQNQYPLADVRLNAGVTVITGITNRVGVVGGTQYITSGLEAILLKASAADAAAGVNDTKYLTPLAIKDSHNIPNVAPGVTGRKMVSNGTDWVSQQDDGWVADGNTWAQSGIDSPTGVITINADLTQKLQNGMRLKYNQIRSLTAYWPFDTNSNSSIGSFTMTDTSVTYTSGKFSNAATFNGSTSKIVVTDNALLKPTGPFTLGFWMKVSLPGATQTVFQSFSANTAYAGIILQLNTAGKMTTLIGANTGTTLDIDYTSMTSRLVVADNTWHYIVVTIKNNYLQLYVDGALDSAKFCITPAYAGTNYVRFGCQNNAGTDASFLSGQIDDAFLINGYSLDQETIKAKFIAATAQGSGNITITKKGIITNVGDFSGGNTLVTVFHGTDFELSTDPITSPYYSSDKVPFGFNPNPDKWKVLGVRYATTNKNTPTLDTWYGGALLTNTGISIVVPIGSWSVEYKATIQMSSGAVAGAFIMKLTLATANNLESDSQLTTSYDYSNPDAVSRSYGFTYGLSNRNIICLSKTTFYLNILVSTTIPSSILIRSNPPATIIFTCAYL